METVNQYIKSMRVDKSQSDMAHALNISLRQYQRYETDGEIPLMKLLSISRMLGFPLIEAFKRIISKLVKEDEQEEYLSLVSTAKISDIKKEVTSDKGSNDINLLNIISQLADTVHKQSQVIEKLSSKTL